MKQKLLLITWIFINIVLLYTSVSMAYLDPSAMTYIVQVVAAIVIGLSTSIGIFFYKIKRKFRKKKDVSGEDGEEVVDEDNKTEE